jgi:hypothetical protein
LGFHRAEEICVVYRGIKVGEVALGSFVRVWGVMQNGFGTLPRGDLLSLLATEANR